MGIASLQEQQELKRNKKFSTLFFRASRRTLIYRPHSLLNSILNHLHFLHQMLKADAAVLMDRRLLQVATWVRFSIVPE